ncbi:hypothetical protein [Silvibacterium dinghuense]|uniref:Uncharacterized protein n=1 Tax=Silvibacterium dinghuense TaxID=1560006 RepID=A0A4V1NVN2_9BACT|nr:hypothetical protein [Silvibacterium dinghuense]RXS96512.1 hypothetical protein ESZ00_00715 [Silvibacterium dinghuense]GGG91417.1 glycosyl transferase [Silvibacterium dinghuense]
MARFELSEETRKRVEEIGSADLVIGVAGVAPFELLLEKIPSWLQRLSPSPGRTVLAFAGVQEMPSQPLPEGLELLPFVPAAHDPSLGPWIELSSAQLAVIGLASILEARGCIVFHPDLAAFDDPGSLQLAIPILEGNCDLVMPVYPEGKYEGLLNKGLLAPLSRSLCGRRVSAPLPSDFGVSARMISRMTAGQPQRALTAPRLLWPATVAGMDGGEICEAPLHIRHSTQSEGLELSTVIGQLVGSLFQEVELQAAQWQRVRGSQAMRALTAQSGAGPETAELPAPDPQPLIDSFVLGFRNLEEVWRIALPPLSLFELQRLARLSPAEFSMPDELWVKIVYDFAVAWHVRRISRGHLLGALTPLYLGWVASYVRSVSDLSLVKTQARLEELAQAFEVYKPYFVSRWRWPDRVS